MNYHMLNLKNYVKQELIDVCLLLWKKFDKQNTGYIDEKDLVTMLRLLDYNPTEREIIEMKDKLKSDDPKAPQDKISKEGFFACVARKERDTDSIEEFLNCFKIFDPNNTGMIEEKTLRYIMCNMGDALSNDEIDNLMKEATNNQFTEIVNEVTYIKYENFAKYLKDLYKPPPKEDPKKKKKK